MFFVLTALAVTFGIAAFMAEWMYPNYISEKKRIRGGLRIAKKEIREFGKIHSEDALRYSSYWQKELKDLIRVRDGLAGELFRMKIEFTAAAIVFIAIMAAVWAFVLYKFIL